MSELPQGWVETPLESIVDILDSQRIPLNSDERNARIAGKDVSKLVPYYGATGQVGFIDDYIFDEPIVLLGEDGVPFFDLYKHKAYRVSGKSWVNNHAHVIRAKPQVTNNVYIEKYLNYFDYTGVVSGSTRLKLTQGAMREIPVKLAPLPEQKRIADKLDTLLARVDATRERLDRIPQILKQFRQSVLAAATTGRLTEVWRESACPPDAIELLNDAKRSREISAIRFRSQAEKKPEIDDLSFSVCLPVGWVTTCFDELAEANRNALKAGPFGSALKKDMYVTNGYKIYGQEQVISGDENLGDYFVSDSKFKELESCSVKPGDILISLVGTIGKVLVLSENCKKGIINPRLVKLSLHKSISRKYIAYYLQGELSQGFFREKSHGGTMDVLNLGLLRELPILLPSVQEQAEIVLRVEMLFALADKLEARYQQARAQVEKLTPALLAKAFRGELVEQDPNDEPAEKLLERIKAQRENAVKVPKGKMKKTG